MTGKTIFKKAKNIKLIAMDIDGVLTAGEILILDSGEEVKLWNVKDRMGFYLVKRSGSGIKLAWITGRGSKQVEKCAKSVGIDFLYQNCNIKMEAISKIMKKTGLKLSEIAFIGDDLVDYHVLSNAGLSVCPKDAPKEIKDAVDYVSPLNGGKGVLRELADMILKSQGFWKRATKDFLS